MKREIRNISLYRAISIILLTASLMVTGTRYVSTGTPDQHGTAATGEARDDDGAEVQLTVSDAIQTHFQVDLTFHSFLLDVVTGPATHAPAVHVVDLFTPGISKNFKILLRRIISTNAP